MEILKSHQRALVSKQRQFREDPENRELETKPLSPEQKGKRPPH